MRTDEGFLREHQAVPTPTLQRTEFGNWHAASIRAYIGAAHAADRQSEALAPSARSACRRCRSWWRGRKLRQAKRL